MSFSRVYRIQIWIECGEMPLTFNFLYSIFMQLINGTVKFALGSSVVIEFRRNYVITLMSIGLRCKTFLMDGVEAS